MGTPNQQTFVASGPTMILLYCTVLYDSTVRRCGMRVPVAVALPVARAEREFHDSLAAVPTLLILRLVIAEVLGSTSSASIFLSSSTTQ
jgi:hypothetical protein